MAKEIKKAENLSSAFLYINECFRDRLKNNPEPEHELVVVLD